MVWRLATPDTLENLQAWQQEVTSRNRLAGDEMRAREAGRDYRDGESMV